MSRIIKCDDLLFHRYVFGGRGPDEWDCYGLVRECYRRMGIGVTDYPTRANDQENSEQLLRAAFADWKRETAPRPGIAVTFRINKRVHIGFMLTKDEFIHADTKLGIHTDKIFNPIWKRSITGFYSWKR